MASATTETADNHGGGHGHAHSPFLAHHFDTPLQQFDSAKFGMWVFICTEILMFGGLFVAYGVWRSLEPEVFHVAHEHLNKLMGATNTIVLLFSSLTAALAVRASQQGKKQLTTGLLVVTIACACVFLVVKYFEYTHKLEEGLLPGHCFGHPWCDPARTYVTAYELPARAHMFFALYFMMTGLHGVHVWVVWRNQTGRVTAKHFTPVEIGALYWHLVDLVWIYLFPLLYLVG
jgi:cytochrome c oxidase subunit 3